MTFLKKEFVHSGRDATMLQDNELETPTLVN